MSTGGDDLAQPAGTGGGDLARAGSTGLEDLRVGQVVELVVGAVAHGGHCVARVDGRVVFVRYALPGERVRVRITDAKPGSFCRADTIEVLSPDPARVDPPCRHFHAGGCGGCDFQHASAAAQRDLKATVLAEQLHRLAGLDVAVQVMALPGDGFGWRSRVRWALDEDGRIGPRRYRSHRVEAIGPDAPCLIAAPALTELAAVLEVPAAVGARRRAASRPDPKDRRRRSRPREPAQPRGRQASRQRGGAGPEVSLISRDGQALAVWDGQSAPTVTERAVGRTFEVMADGFWQVHPAAADALGEAVRRAVDPTGSPTHRGLTAWDLYGGVGLFAAVLADLVGPSGTTVTIEGDRAASALAEQNLADLPGVRAVSGSVADVLDELPDPAIVVLDPPRSGAGPELCRRIAERRPGVVVYVACDPAALGRDTAALMAAGYRLDGLEAFDCFPQTHHVECVARFVPA